MTARSARVAAGTNSTVPRADFTCPRDQVRWRPLGSARQYFLDRITARALGVAKLLACEEKPMSTYYALVSSLIFAAVAAAHLLRLLNRWAVQVGSYSVPMPVSWVGLVIAALIGAWGFAQLAH